MPDPQTPTQKCRDDAGSMELGPPPALDPCPDGKARDATALAAAAATWSAAQREASFVACSQKASALSAATAGHRYCTNHFPAGSSDRAACDAGVDAAQAAADEAANAELAASSEAADAQYLLQAGSLPCV